MGIGGVAVSTQIKMLPEESLSEIIGRIIIVLSINIWKRGIS